MITQNMKTLGSNQVRNTSGSYQTRGRQGGSGFDLIIDGSIKSQQKISGYTETSDNRRTASCDAEKPETVHKEDKLKSIQTNNSPTKAITDKQTQEPSLDGENSKVDAKDDDITADEALLEKMAIMLQSLQETVMRLLNLTSEDLDRLLKEQGMSITDLLQPDMLQQFVLTSSGETDLLAVLTNEDLAASMNGLLQAVEEVKDMSGLVLTKEQMDAILSKAEEAIREQVLQEEVSAFIQGEAGEMSEVEDNQTTIIKSVDSSKGEGSDTKADASSTNGISETVSGADVQEGFQGAQDSSTRDQRDLKSADQFQTFIENLANPNKDVSADFTEEVNRVVDIRDIANQIIERIRITTTSDLSSMELQLNPEHLGKVNLTVQSKNGVMTAQFVVQNEISKEAIESQLHTLRETLNQQGIKVEAIEVTISSYTFEQDNQEPAGNKSDSKKQNTGKHITLEEAFNVTEIPTEEDTLKDLTGMTGSQINYTA